MPFFPLIFMLLPILEIAAFIIVGGEIGILPTLGLALLSALLGSIIIKYQGFVTLLAVREAMQAGKLPLTEIFDGICLVAAGALLITPGFVSDTLGFLLLVPAVRGALRRYIRDHTNWSAEVSQTRFERAQDNPDIIEGEYESLDDEGRRR